MQCPIPYTSNRAEREWSQHIESTCKDVECTFGMLKGRFRALKVPCRYANKDELDNVWWTCCILHNWLLVYDGLDQWDHGVQWQFDDGLNEDCEEVIAED